MRAQDMRFWIKAGGIASAMILSLSSAFAQTAQGQTSASSNSVPGGGESSRYNASAMAVTRALNICSGLWQGGLAPDIIESELNGRDPTYGEMATTLKTDIDHNRRTVTVEYLPDMPARTVVWRPVLGCVQLPVGASAVMASNLPQVPASFRAPDLDKRAWPMGDEGSVRRLPSARDKALQSVVDGAFSGEYKGRTWGVVIVKDGHIVAERYAPGFGPHIGSQTHSAAKSFASSLAGIAAGRGLLKLSDHAPISAWRKAGDPRGTITVEHLLHMASGLYASGPATVFRDIYTQGALVDDLATTNFLDAMPGKRFQYSPSDTMLIMRSVREAMKDDAAYLRFPHEALFWRIGMTRTTMNGDWNGNYFGSGQTWSTARDFARFGLLYANDGMWEGERILPEGWARYAATPAPAQPSSGAGYGAQFWLYGGKEGLPADAFTPSGGQGHYAMIIASKKLVVVRRGFDGPGDGFPIDKFSADVLKAIEE